MKNILYIILLILVSACDSENASDCFQRAGNTIRKEVSVADFTRILVNPNVELILKQGPTTAVVIETGDHLINEVSAIVDGDRLILSDTNDCGFFRDINQTKIFVTAPDIVEVRSATQFDISSDGVLEYSSLSLLSEDFSSDTGSTTGFFDLKINSKSLFVVSNNIASFAVNGQVDNLRVSFFSGIGRFDGRNLTAQNITVFHRGTNKIIVHPIESIAGEIRSTGDVIAVNRPPMIEVEAFFTGKLIFEEEN